MTRDIVRAAWFFVIAAVGACADDGNDGGGGGNGGGGGGNGAPAVSCTATIAPASYAYAIGDAGQMLTLGPATSNELVLERVAPVSGTIYGSWVLGDQVNGIVTLHAEIAFDPGHVSVSSRCTARGQTVTAIATSAATITDQMVTTLQSDSDVQYIH